MYNKPRFKQINAIDLLNNKIENFRNTTGERPSFILVDKVYYNRICFNETLNHSTNNYELQKQYQDIPIVLIPGVEQPYIEVIGDAEHTYLNNRS